MMAGDVSRDANGPRRECARIDTDINRYCCRPLLRHRSSSEAAHEDQLLSTGDRCHLAHLTVHIPATRHLSEGQSVIRDKTRRVIR